MARLRIRLELNRGGAGVPLPKLARVVDEARKFFDMLADDVRIAGNGGQWLAADFDSKALNFTAEYIGEVSPSQVRDFYAAFDGVTSLRRATISQFARIADAIDQDELIGFGLYQGDAEEEPSEWRSLSKRDAVRILGEIRLLEEEAGDGEQESRLPAAASGMFHERREREVGTRALESRVLDRIARVEGELSEHSQAISELRGRTAVTEQSLGRLLSSVEDFCDRAAQQFAKAPIAPVAPVSLPLPVEALPVAAPVPIPPSAPVPPPSDTVVASSAAAIERPARNLWIIPVSACLAAAAAGILYFGGVFTPPASSASARVETAVVTPNPVAAVAPAPTLPAVARVPAASVRVEVYARESTWLSAWVDGKAVWANLIDANQVRTFEAATLVKLRLGNAGGVDVRWNGKAVGPIGRNGQVKDIDFTPARFQILPGN
ncbi:MAG: DUF4115 domain-containing protein [Bryobacteraceae bacterium]